MIVQAYLRYPLVAPLYDFAAAGPGTFTFEPETHFQIIGAEERVADPELTIVPATTAAIEVQVEGDLAKRELQQLNKRAVDICTTASRKSFIDSSYSEAKSLASIASSYVSSRGASDSLFRAYWGSNSVTNVNRVLNAVSGENSSSRTWVALHIGDYWNYS